MPVSRQRRRASARSSAKPKRGVALAGTQPVSGEPFEIIKGFEIVKGEVPRAPLEGRVLGTAICEAGHTVLVIGEHSGRPVIEVHLGDDEVEMVQAMLTSARSRH